MADVTLKPCPFCGGNELSHGTQSPGFDGSSETGNVQCHTCDAVVFAVDEDDAISKWNTRAPSPELAAARAERRVVEAAVEWVKPPLWSGDATKAGLKLASAVDALQRAKGGANG